MNNRVKPEHQHKNEEKESTLTFIEHTRYIYLFILNSDFYTHTKKKKKSWFGNQVALQLDQLHIILIITKINCTHTHVSINSTFCRCVFVVVVPSSFESVVVSEQIFVICNFLLYIFSSLLFLVGFFCEMIIFFLNFFTNDWLMVNRRMSESCLQYLYKK